MHKAKVHGLSLVWIRNNKAVHRKCYGIRKSGSSHLVDSNTVFEAASLTKPVFAYAVLKLAGEGFLDLDKPLFEYLAYRDVAHDERYQKINARTRFVKYGQL